jgi:hypothetical protein
MTTVCACALAGVAYFTLVQNCYAFNYQTGCGGGFGGIPGGGFGGQFQGGFGGIPGGGAGGGGAGGGGMQTPQIQRSTNFLPNPVNYWQYTQVTAVKPIIGTVRIYNTFGTLGVPGGGGLGQGFTAGTQFGGGGGFGGQTGAGGNIPGIGTSSGGDDPPQGVLLHVQYANMFFPNQQQINAQSFQPPQGGGGFPGFGGGFPGFGGKGYFGSGRSGL